MSGYRLFIGQLVRDIRRREVEDAFSKFGEVVRIDIKNGFGFVEYEHSRDAEEAIRKMDGEEFLGRRIIVEYARGRKKERERGERGGGGGGRDSRSGNNGPERSDYRVIVEGLGRSTSWQDLKDAFRSSGDILFTDVRRDRYDEYYGIVEFRYKDDIEHAIRKMDGAEVNGHKIRVKEDRKKKRSMSRDKKKRRSGSREKRSGSGKRRSGSRDRKSSSKEKEKRSPSKEKERRSPSKEKERRSPSKERRSEERNDKERRSPSKEKERERRSGSRDSKPREESEERNDRKRSRSPDREKVEEEKENKRSKQDDEKEPEKDDREDNN